jgi:hypothetical protein
MSRPQRRTQAFALALAMFVLASVAFASTWAVKFPGLAADVNATSVNPGSLVALCEALNLRKPPRLGIKSLSFERVATKDKSLFNLVSKAKLSATKMEVVVRPLDVRTQKACALRLKNTIFTNYSLQVQAKPNGQHTIESFSLSFEQVSVEP